MLWRWRLNIRVERWCIYSGPAFVVMFGIGYWAIAHLVPPPSPLQTPAEVVSFYSHRTNYIRLGLLVALAGVPLQLPFVTAISRQLRRIEGKFATLSAIQLAAGALGVLILTYPFIIMEATAFRPERNPDVTQGLNDVAWTAFLGVFFVAVLQNIAIAIGIFSDRRPDPIIPRWLGYFNIFVALSFIPAGLLFFVKSGPFAWPGIFVWWIPAILFFVWYLVMAYALLGALKHEIAESVGRDQSTAGLNLGDGDSQGVAHAAPRATRFPAAGGDSVA
jgi:hypothetical protein